MKNRILAILLIALMLLPALTACDKTTPSTETEVVVYTLHMIKDESTTDEAIKKVALALNRTLFYRVGSCIEIIAYTEDEYYDAIEAKYTEMEEYKKKLEEEKANKKDKDKNNNSENVSDVSVDVFTGDDYLDLMADGGEYIREKPRFDIFLINDYDKYYEYATEGKLSAINAPLTSECKILNDYIHPTILSAASVNGKTYGVPLNTIIGEYTYMVFDKELLEEHQVDYQTMQTMDDLQSYLETIAANHADVVPLSNTADPTDVDYIFSSLSPAYVKNKYVYSSYESSDIASYYSVIQKFNSLGYLREADEDDRIAVQFVSGNEETIAQMEKETGREYEYVVYSNPVANNETCIEGIFAFSSYCTSNELTAAMEIITAIYTNEALANLFAYGIEKEHYELTDEGQVKRLNNDYMIKSSYAGNQFITYTLEGEDTDKWEKAKLQNQKAEIAVDIGFVLDPTEFKWTYEDEKEEEQEVIIASPDYLAIINGVVGNYYNDIVTGNALELDLETLYLEAELGIEDTLRANLEKTYASRLQNDYSNTVSAKYALDTSEGTKIYNAAAEEVSATIYTTVEKELRTKYTKQYTDELISKYDDEEKLAKVVEEMVNELLTKDFINEAIERDYGQEYIDELTMSQYNREVQTKVDAALKSYIATSTYTDALNAAIVSDEFNAELEAALNSDLSGTINETVNTLITSMMKEYFAVIIEECNDELDIAIDEFVDKVVAESAKFDGDEAMTEEEVRYELGLMDKETETDEEGEVISETYVEKDITPFKYVMDIITNQYYKVFGDPTAA